MPMVLQKLALLSPMSWGLEGFLDILLRDGELRTVAPKALLLFGFALISLLLAGMRMRRARFT
jgi:ABC-2 type transport system permease protein